MTEPLTVAEAKLNLRVDCLDEDSFIAELISSARAHVENVTGLVLTPRTITETAASLGSWIDLRSWPVTAITAVRYPVAGVMTALGSTAWLVNTKRRPVRLLPASPWWGLGSSLTFGFPGLPVEIDVNAGYASPADVPFDVKRAMHMLIAHWHENRLAVEAGIRAAAVEVPIGVDSLLRPYRRYAV